MVRVRDYSIWTSIRATTTGVLILVSIYGCTDASAQYQQLLWIFGVGWPTYRSRLPGPNDAIHATVIWPRPRPNFLRPVPQLVRPCCGREGKIPRAGFSIASRQRRELAGSSLLSGPAWFYLFVHFIDFVLSLSACTSFHDIHRVGSSRAEKLLPSPLEW